MHDHWTEDEKAALEGVASLEEAADIGISILKRMKAEGKPVIQICGPMSTGGAGSIEKNMSRFEAAVDTAVQNGLTVFNQIPFQNAIIRVTDYYEGAPYNTDILEVFYRRMFESGYMDGILLLPDWESSKGAIWERELALKLGMNIEDYPIEWLES
jgi:hypothetical protein